MGVLHRRRVRCRNQQLWRRILYVYRPPRELYIIRFIVTSIMFFTRSDLPPRGECRKTRVYFIRNVMHKRTLIYARKSTRSCGAMDIPNTHKRGTPPGLCENGVIILSFPPISCKCHLDMNAHCNNIIVMRLCRNIASTACTWSMNMRIHNSTSYTRITIIEI